MFNTLNPLFEHTYAYARWAHMPSFLSVRDLTKYHWTKIYWTKNQKAYGQSENKMAKKRDIGPHYFLLTPICTHVLQFQQQQQQLQQQLQQQQLRKSEM